MKGLSQKEKNKIDQRAIKSILISAKSAGINFWDLSKEVRYLIICAYQQGAVDSLENQLEHANE
jgi:hypothetical protein